jgi:anti-sigma B factor antagonist
MEQEVCVVEVLTGRSEGIRILRLVGPLTLRNMFTLQGELNKEHTPVTIFELTSVPYMDSAGMGLVLRHYVSAQRRGHKVIAVGANYRTLELFKLTKADMIIPMTATIEEAENL